MDLARWMKENRWNMNSFSNELGIARLTLKNAIEKKSDISLRVALKIVKATKNQVTLQDLCADEELVRGSKGVKTKEKTSKAKKNKKKNHKENPKVF